MSATAARAVTDAYDIPLESIDVSDPRLYQEDIYYPYFERLRREQPVHYRRDGMYGSFWSVTRFSDIIEVETAIGVHTYVVRENFIVQPTELWVTDPREGAWLTLTTCHPKFSARERLIVTAELVDGPNAAVILGTR